MIMYISSICVIGVFARGTSARGKSNFVPRSLERRLSCRCIFLVMQFQLFGRLAREQVQILYDHSHSKNKIDDVRRFFPPFLIDVSTCYDVITRCGQKIALIFVPVTWCASASDEDDFGGGSRYTLF